jgi:hypothetical protein
MVIHYEGFSGTQLFRETHSLGPQNILHVLSFWCEQKGTRALTISDPQAKHMTLVAENGVVVCSSEGSPPSYAYLYYRTHIDNTALI